METKRFCFFCDNLLQDWAFRHLRLRSCPCSHRHTDTHAHIHPRSHTHATAPGLLRHGARRSTHSGPPKGRVTARSRRGHGTRVTALSRHCHGTLSRHGHGTVTAHHFLKNPMCFSTIRKMTWRGARRTPCAHATTRRWGARSTPRLHATTGPEGARSTPSVQGDGKDPKKARGPSRIDSS